ncbi:MAG: hypothetical protein Q7S92_02160 [Candidatus Diapherotrites archaeon]|nr:hypothetical protein [Candidatus Diapherotrites archaeon]
MVALILGFFLLNAGIEYQKSNDLYSNGFKELAGMENLQAKYENISDNIAEILQKIGGTSWIIESGKITFTETLPDKKGKQQYALDLETYAKFTGQHKDNLDINLNTASLSLNELTIQPYDVNYGHPLQTGKKAKNQNILQINPKTINFEGYQLQITLQNQSYESLSTNVKECTGSCTKGIFIDLKVLDSSKILETSYIEDNADPNQVSTITIKTSGNAGNDIVITLGLNGKLEIKNENSVPIEIETSVDFGAGNVPEIEWSKNSIQVGDSLKQRKT